MSLKTFYIKFDILLSQINDELPFYSVVTGDFNTRCSGWLRNDITNFVGKEIDFNPLILKINQSRALN